MFWFIYLSRVIPTKTTGSPLSPENKLLTYKSYLQILTYAAPVWSIISDKPRRRRRLQRVQNRLLKGRYTRIRKLHENTGIEIISEYIDNISEKLYSHGVRLWIWQDTLITHEPPYSRFPISFRNPHHRPPAPSHTMT